MDTTTELSNAPPRAKLLRALWAGKLTGAVLAATLGLALGLRLYGLSWDDGYSFTPHPDERAILMKVGELSLPSPGDARLLLNADESPWNPRWFPYGSLPLYAVRLVQYAASAVPGVTVEDLRLPARAISALADVAAVAGLFLLGSRVYGRREGLLAAVLATLAVIHIQLSHFFAVDTLLALFTVLALYFMYRVATGGRPRDSVVAAVFVALGLATKVSLAPVLFAFAMAHVMYVSGALVSADLSPRQRLQTSMKGIAGGFAASIAVLVLVQPYMFLDWSRFYADFVEQSEMVRRIRDYPYTRQYIDTTPYWYHVRQLATWGLGWPLGVVAWGGLLYAAVRGARLKYSLGYLVAGWLAPAALLLYSNSLWTLFLSSALAVASLLAIMPFRRPDTRSDLLVLAWVAPYLLITGALEVKFLRYLLPVTPFLLLFGARLMFDVWDRAAAWRRWARPALVTGLVGLLASTGFYALSYMSVYAEPHTAVRTSQWLNRNASDGSLVLKEHWEEGLPGLHDHRIRELPLYENDGPAKLGQISEMLAEADFVVFFSNRLYGTIPRLPGRYPMSGEYYRLLFSGHLGYELVNAETAYPRLAGISFAHETFQRPGVPMPAGFDAYEPGGLRIGLGFADESFSVYDHPTGLLFRNSERYDARTLRDKIEGAALGTAETGRAGQSEMGLMLSPDQARDRREGGTWTDIVRPDAWPSRLPVLGWLVVVQGIALLAWPLSFVLLRPLADRGYLLSKLVGLLAVAVPVWLLASLGWAAFSAGTVSAAVGLLAAVSLAVLVRERRAMKAFVRARWRTLLVAEGVFLAAFFGFLLLRMANPDLWHPHLGGEKPMDLAYLNAVLRSGHMPPYDPWFAGGYLNYYYWGQFLTATLIHATGIAPAVAYNLAVPLFAALTAAAAFALVYSLAESTLRTLPSKRDRAVDSRKPAWSPVAAGVVGALFVSVIGNLDGAIQVGRGFWRAFAGNAPFGGFDFWRSSRMMPPGNEITEFPFFTFLFGDLHAHMMALPFTLLALALALAVVLGAVRQGGPSSSASLWRPEALLRLAALGVVVGALRLINAWDYPTYLIVAAAAVFLAAYLRNGGLSLKVLVEAGVLSVLVFAVGYIVFLPYHASYEAFFTSMQATTNTTVLWHFLAITGVFIFIIGSFLVRETRAWMLPIWRRIREAVVGRAQAGTDVRGQEDATRIAGARMAVAIAAVLVFGYVVYAGLTAWTGSTVPFLVAFVALLLVASIRFLRANRADAPQLAFVSVIIGVSLMLAIGLDVYRVDGDIDRMNSVFKFYLQIWVMLGVAAAYLLWRLWQAGPPGMPAGGKLWTAALAVLIVGASLYPILGTQDRLARRFQPLPLTLNGTDYMAESVYVDAKGRIDLASDLEAIRWLQAEVPGSPVLLEAATPEYRWGGRVSIYTGLPSVVGWKWHQEQQRWGYREAVGERITDVESIYGGPDAAAALSLMQKYGVEYVYVGQLERLYYPEAGLAKFERELSPHLEPVFRSDQVTIYRLHPG